MNTLIGNLGHASVVVAFVAALVAALAYYFAARGRTLADAPDKAWQQLGRVAFTVHGLAVLGVVGALYDIIYHHRYEYYYAWSHSSNHLPVKFMVSCFWEGQEGSFLLWIFWHVCIGGLLIWKARRWEAPVMAVFAGVQVFLTSMILGVILTSTFRVGSSPFLLLKDFMGDIPVYKLNPNYVPTDGNGLNPLLQNYWMVIHPPTLFLGFALTLVPFAFAVAALWQRAYTEWIRPTLSWALAAASILGVGIVMGAYWAYETLNFGGYWNWDPVENAVYIPWLVLVAGAHLLVVFQRSRVGLKAAFALSIGTFLLVLYATFLTRSGVLGNASVHSFTDLGLSGQLLSYLGAFVVLAVALLAYRWRELPADAKELTAYNPETWVFVGAAVLGLGAFQVLATTSIPVYNALVGLFGVKSSLALPADQIAHYTKFQLWVGVGFAVLTGIAQLLWWQRVETKQKLSDVFTVPLILTLLFASLFILLTKLHQPAWIALLTVSLFAVISNGTTLVKLARHGTRLSGGAVAHIGIALMLIGILYSSGYSNVISKNVSGLLYSKELPEEINRDNVLLWRNQAVPMSHYSLLYKGQFVEAKGIPGYVNKDDLFMLPEDEYRAIARAEVKHEGKQFAKIGDTLNIYPENTFFEVEFTDKDNPKEKFTLFPRAQVNPEMGLVASPDLKVFWDHDIYAHVSTVPKPDEEKEWTPMQEYKAKIGDTLILNDYIAVLRQIEPAHDVTGMGLQKGDLALQADLLIEGETKKYHAHPIWALKGNLVGRVADEIPDLGLRLMFMSIDPKKGEFTLGASTSQKDYIILKAVEKPGINLLWIGTCLMGIGLGIAAWRRGKENKPLPPAAQPAPPVRRERQVA